MPDIRSLGSTFFSVIEKVNETTLSGISKINGFGWSSQPAPPPTGYDRGVFIGSNNSEYITISYPSSAIVFGTLLQTGIEAATCTSNASNGRLIYAGGLIGSTINNISYITISTTGISSDFGDLRYTTYWAGSTSNASFNRGIIAYGATTPPGYNNVLDYITISTTGNSTVFGGLTINADNYVGTSNGKNSRGVFIIGNSNSIHYITITSLGDSTDFGDLTVARRYSGACSNGQSNRGIFCGGNIDPYTDSNTIDYITINSTGNATDFGDLTVVSNYARSCSNMTYNRAVTARLSFTPVLSVKYEQLVISTLGNASVFGDLVESGIVLNGGASNSE